MKNKNLKKNVIFLISSNFKPTSKKKKYTSKQKKHFTSILFIFLKTRTQKNTTTHLGVLRLNFATTS
jgi:hypothetical protein